jgi:cell division septation protein DedD
VSESHEPSYYEIALTNRQVLFAFVILLVCLLAAFIAGVWVGRGGEVQAAVPSAPERVAEQAAPAAAGKDGEALEKLSFFGDDKAHAAQGNAPPAAGDTTLRQDLDRGAEPAPNTAPAPKPQPPAAEKPPAAAVPPAHSEPAPARATVTPTPPAAAPSKAEPKPEASEAADGLVVQVFSSHDKEQAEKVLQRLNRGGSKAFLSPVEVSGQTMYRVRIGPFADRAEAQKVADQVRHDFKLDTWITQSL